MKISPARTAAFDILFSVETEKAFSSILLPLYEKSLSPTDRALCHEITLGTLRRQIYLDRLIDSLAAGKKLDVQVRIALRIALYQIKFLDKIPAYSAINESVNLVQRARKTSAKGFVNAILRRAVRESVELPFTDEIDKLSIETSHPRWLIEKWVNEHGEAFTRELASANNALPAVAFRVLNPGGKATELINRSTASKYVDGCFLASGFDQEILDLAESGSIYLQDEASQMVASLINIPDRGTFLDVCPAPGGKTGMIARRFDDKSSLIAAGDIHWSRIMNLRENCERQAPDAVTVLQFDAAVALPFAESIFDAVLVDAPCSGTGTIRHNPEIRYSVSAKALAELSMKQLSILSNASKLVKSGGTVVYSTCSLEREENEVVCGRFLSENPRFQIVRPTVADRFITNEGFARTWPHRDELDGFFIAVLRCND